MNYTQVPNWVFEAMPHWPNAMTKIVLIVARQTYGYHRELDEISISQFQNWTGLSRQGVISGIKQAIKMGVVRKENLNTYGLIEPAQPVNTVDQASQLSRPELVNSVDQQEQGLVNSVDQTSQLSRPELVNSVDPQKKEKEILKESTTTPLPPNKQKQVGGGGDQTPDSLSEQTEQPEVSYHPESYKLLAQAGCVAAGPMRQAAALPPDEMARLIQTITAGSGGPGAIIRAALDQLQLPPELKYQEKRYAPQRTMGQGRGRAPEAQPLAPDRPQRSELSQAELDELDQLEREARQDYAAQVAARNAQRQQRQSQSGSHV